MTTLRATPSVDGVIDASWFAPALRDTSATWRLMYAEDAALGGDFECDPLDIELSLAGGWPGHAPALVASAWWLAEALWRNGVAGAMLEAAHLRRARQIGLAVLAVPPVGVPPHPAAAAWLASELFDPRSRTAIRLQLARPRWVDEEAGAQLKLQISPVQAARLVVYARSAMGAA